MRRKMHGTIQGSAPTDDSVLRDTYLRGQIGVIMKIKVMVEYRKHGGETHRQPRLFQPTFEIRQIQSTIEKYLGCTKN